MLKYYLFYLRVIIFTSILLSFGACQSFEDDLLPVLENESKLISESALKSQTGLEIVLRNDPDFISFLQAQETYTEKFHGVLASLQAEKVDAYVANLETIIENSTNTYADVSQVASLTGFSSVEEYSTVMRKLHQSATQLVEKYPSIFDTNNLGGISIIIDAMGGNDLSTESCRSKYNNCRGTANANHAFELIGCVALLSIPVTGAYLGPACAIATSTKHYYAMQGCNIAYQECQDQAE